LILIFTFAAFILFIQISTMLGANYIPTPSL
jgi:hypothetical protein